MIFKGRGVYGAVALGEAYIFKSKAADVKVTSITDTDAELTKLAAAKQKAIQQLTMIHDKVQDKTNEENAKIFELHIMMLEDDDFNESIERIIKTEHINAQAAAAKTRDEFAQMFSAMDDTYMQARAADVRDISDRLIACLGEDKGSDDIMPDKMIVCADDLSPSETVSLDKERVLAFVTASGSPDSHTAILARSMNIPAVTGIGKEFLSHIKDGDIMIVDGHTGEVFTDPDDETTARLKAKQAEDNRKRELLQQLKGKENITLDGIKTDIFANISDADSAALALENDAGGIGLFRSEFLYLESDTYPTEEQQLAVYKSVLKSMAGKRVIIRTLDIGADKQADYFALENETNPALGLRAIRLCLARPEIFKTQLRALYRASVFGSLGIMFPMITSVSEVEKCLAMCESVKAELKADGIPFDDSTQTGIMIETPAAALISDRLAPMVDFFSVGTNDLIQYTLACDRQDPRLEAFADPHHEGVLRLIELSAANAHKNGKWIGICGELAADLTLTEAFLKMGIDELSVSPTYVLPLREKIRSLKIR